MRGSASRFRFSSVRFSLSLSSRIASSSGPFFVLEELLAGRRLRLGTARAGVGELDEAVTLGGERQQVEAVLARERDVRFSFLAQRGFALRTRSCG